MVKSFAEKIREERERKGLTLEQLGGKIGSTKSYIWELENKPTTRPSAEKVFKLAEVFGVPAEYLMDDTGKVPREVEKAFFSKYQKLSDENKRVLQRFVDSLDDD